ncbi:MAG: sulfate adenylyltransferase subunit 1 [Nocardioidaceae bacterium]
MPATSELLRLATAGSVDDGKSTLIGRLLYDAKSLMADQVADLHDSDGTLDLARLTDGLRSEREQGITIDVAYRYFATPRRRFILADTPGHAEYTRNMVTGASNADVAILLVDAAQGVLDQTRRHAAIAALLEVREVVLAINKMDLVDWSEERFDAIVRDFGALARQLGVAHTTPIPLSALHGDNVVTRSARLPWYVGRPLLEHLETIELEARGSERAPRMPVQRVVEHDGRRLLMGRLAGGRLRPGDEVVVLPRREATRVASIETLDGQLDVAAAGQSITVGLEDELEVDRGDVICGPGRPPVPRRELKATLCWMAERPLHRGERLALKHGTRTTYADVAAILDRLDLATLRPEDAGQLALNDLGRVRLRTGEALVTDPYGENRTTGSFILIDPETNDTVAAGLLPTV